MNDVNTAPYHHGNLPEALVNVGYQLAAEGGPEAVKLREVARRVGVSPSAAYRHIQGQEGLVDAVRGRIVEQLDEHMASAITEQGDGASPQQRVGAAGRGYFTFATSKPHLFRCLAASFVIPPSTPGNPFERLVGLTNEVLRDRTDLSDDDAAVALWSAVHGISLLCTTGALQDLPAERQEHLLDVTLSIAVRGLGPGGH